MEGYVDRICRLLRGNEPDAKARFFAAGHTVMIGRTYAVNGEMPPLALLQVTLYLPSCSRVSSLWQASREPFGVATASADSLADSAAAEADASVAGLHL